LTLTEGNQEVVNNLCRFLRKNYNLVSVNLQNMRLTTIVINRIVKSLKYSLSVKSVLLGGNMGITQDLIVKLKDYLNCCQMAP